MEIITQILLVILILILVAKPLIDKFKAKQIDTGGSIVIGHIVSTIKNKGYVKIKTSEEELVLVEQAKDKPKKDE